MDDEVRKVRGNSKIDKALNALMKKADDLAPDVAVKVIMAAIAWEKVKAKIAEDANDFDPDNL